MDLADLLLPAIFAGAVATTVTVAVERFGGLVGGFLGTLPTTIVPAAIGIAAEAPDVEGFRAAMYATAPGMLLSALFLLVWRLLPPRLPDASFGARLGLVVAASLGAWLAGAIALVVVLAAVGASLAVALVAIAAIVVVGLWATARGQGTPRAMRRASLVVLGLRGVAAALAIFVAVWLARSGDGLLAGVAAVFPAIFLTTMLALSLSHGDAVPAGAVGPMMVGSASVASFAAIAAFTLPALGPGLGALIAWLGAAAGVQLPLFLVARLIARRLAARAEPST